MITFATQSERRAMAASLHRGARQPATESERLAQYRRCVADRTDIPPIWQAQRAAMWMARITQATNTPPSAAGLSAQEFGE